MRKSRFSDHPEGGPTAALSRAQRAGDLLLAQAAAELALVDVIFMDVEATPAHRAQEVDSTKTMIDPDG